MKNPYTARYTRARIPYSLCVSFYAVMLLLGLSPGWVKAAALSGTYTICKSGCSYSSITAAVADLNANGVSSAVTFNISAGTYYGAARLENVSGVSAKNTITFNGAGRYSTIMSDSAQQVMWLHKSTYVILQNMAFQNTVNSKNANGIALKMDSNVSCTVTGCRIIAPQYVSPQFVYGNGLYITVPNKCTISNNRFEGGYIGISMYGYNTQGYGSNMISNNRFIGFYYYGIYENSGLGQVKNTITQNVFDSSNQTLPYGIYLTYENGATITGNILHNATVYLYDINYNSATDLFDITNNMVITTGTFYAYDFGFAVMPQNGNVRIAHNTVYDPSSYHYGYGVYINSNSTTGKVDIMNNILDVQGTGTTLPFYIGGKASNYGRIDGNNYYTGSATFGISFLGTTYSSYAAFARTANAMGYERYGRNIKTTYYNPPTDVHLDHSVPNANGIYAGVKVDIDGDPRCTLFPSAGADESNNGKTTKPSAQVIKGPSKVYDESPAVFTDSSGYSILNTYKWYVDGKYVTDSSVLLTSLIKSPSTVIALVTENCAGKDSTYRTFTVNYASSAPVSDFIADRNKVMEGDSVSFSDLSTNAPSSWQWKISPDSVYSSSGVRIKTYKLLYGNTLNSENPKVQFLYAGKYNVCLTASNMLSATKAGTGNTECKSSYVNVLTASTLGTATLANQSQGYLFDNGGPGANYYGTGKTQGVVIDACADSTYLVFTSFATNCGNDYVRVYNGKDNTGKLLNKCASTSTGFSGLGPGYTGGVGTGSCTYSCIPGMGAKADTFRAGKQMYIEMASPLGSSGPGFSAYYWTKPAKVNKPVASFISSENAHHDTICPGNIATFTNLSSGANLSYLWDLDGDFSNGFESTKQNATYGWVFPHNAVVTLIVSNCAGTDTFKRTMHVVMPPTPKASFTVDNADPTTDDIVYFTSTTPQCVSSYTWTMKHTYNASTDTGRAIYRLGTGTNSANPAVSFTDTGYYTITLYATNVSGSNTIVKTAYVHVRESNCVPAVNTLTSSIGISLVKFAGINNTSSQGVSEYTSYVNNHSQAGYAQLGYSYPITVKRDTPFFSSETRTVYIDLYHNGHFIKMAQDSGNASTATWNASIKIPSNAKPGATVMRVAANYGSDTNHVCGGNTAGEYEDYRLYIIPDTVRPVITLSGADTIVIEEGFTFLEPGYSAISSYGANLTSKVIKSYSPKPKGIYLRPGLTIIAYDVTDSNGNNAITKYRYVNVLPDTMRPTLTVAGPDTLYAPAKNDPAAFTTPQKVLVSEDLVDGTMPDTITPARIPLNKIDTVLVTYTTSDLSKNRSIAYRWVVVYDTSHPILTLKGNSPAKVQVNTSYTDAGVSIKDEFFTEAQLSAGVVLTGAVDIHKVGRYILTYNVSNPYGLKARPVSRMVDVTDSIKPVAKLKGPDPDSVQVGTQYNDPGISATDNYYPSVTITKGGSFYSLFSSGTPTRLGAYVIKYTATDSSGNAASVTRTIRVTDSVAPVVKLKGAVVDTICRWARYTDSGYIATDNYYATVKVDTEGTFTNTSIPGIYKLRYKATDSSRNVGYSEYRYIYVKSDNDNECKSGIREGLSLDKYIRVYPNPTTGQLNINAALPGNEKVVVKITNALGQELAVNTRDLGGNTFSVDLSSQSAGLYLLSISTAKDRIVKQVILAK